MTKKDIPTFTSAAILAIFGKVIEFKQFVESSHIEGVTLAA
jgi:hypothetical protein